MIHGRVSLRAATQIHSARAWQHLRHLHCVDTEQLPYKRTFGLPITFCERVSPPIPYARKRGAVGIVKYAPTV